eukprot:TRINITY_DN13059_c0_g1_i1.p1 TRINITY_DN13059_c0_g1~~TRINITY_DN13059_c0_g1_i1.p1  ORF type:complete len:371 (-),score=31.86 TRINITY_DN13059_c0_g1_i1:61-1116(-)
MSLKTPSTCCSIFLLAYILVVMVVVLCSVCPTTNADTELFVLNATMNHNSANWTMEVLDVKCGSAYDCTTEPISRFPLFGNDGPRMTGTMGGPSVVVPDANNNVTVTGINVLYGDSVAAFLVIITNKFQQQVVDITSQIPGCSIVGITYVGGAIPLRVFAWQPFGTGPSEDLLVVGADIAGNSKYLHTIDLKVTPTLGGEYPTMSVDMDPVTQTVYANMQVGPNFQPVFGSYPVGGPSALYYSPKTNFTYIGLSYDNQTDSLFCVGMALYDYVTYVGYFNPSNLDSGFTPVAPIIVSGGYVPNGVFFNPLTRQYYATMFLGSLSVVNVDTGEVIFSGSLGPNSNTQSLFAY